MTKDELQKFCGKDDIRSYLCELITVGAFTYATNGHICVRVPRLDGEIESDTDSCKKLAGKIDEYLRIEFSEWQAVPECKYGNLVDCLICHGTGAHQCSCGHEHDCPDCNNTGKQESPHIPVKVGESFFADKYLSMIQGWEIAPAGGMNVAGIRCNDAIGVLMPRREK
jgi:hypothetical protein